MGMLTLNFTGNSDEYEYDLKKDIVIFHDKVNNLLILGKNYGINIECDVQKYDSMQGTVMVRGSDDVKMSISNPTFFKYNDNVNYTNRFKVYWNMQETVIWDTELHRRVDDNDVPKYIKKIEKEQEKKERKKIYQEEKKKEEEDELEDYRYEKDEWW